MHEPIFIIFADGRLLYFANDKALSLLFQLHVEKHGECIKKKSQI